MCSDINLCLAAAAAHIDIVSSFLRWKINETLENSYKVGGDGVTFADRISWILYGGGVCCTVHPF